MERATWTDERLDDLVARIDSQFELLRADMAEFRTEMRTEMRELRSDLTVEIRASRRDMFHGFIALFGSQAAIFAVLMAERL